MWLWFLAAAALARPQVALELTAPTGTSLFDAEVEIGGSHRFEHSEDDRSWRVHLHTRFEGGQVAVEGTLEELRGRRVIVRDTRTALLDEHAPGELKLEWKRLDGPFTLQSQWARALSPPPSGPLPDGRARYALIWDDAALHHHPLSDQPPAERRELPEGRTEPGSQVAPYRVVHTHSDEWIELEPVPVDEALHCHTTPPPDTPIPWPQHYVRTTDLHPVTARAISASFDDGSSYSVAAGVVITPLGEGLYEAHAGNLRIPLRLSDDEIDTRYRPTSMWKVNPSGQTLRPVEGVLGELPVGPVRWVGEAPPVVQGRSGVRTPRVVIRQPCAEVQLVVPAERLQ